MRVTSLLPLSVVFMVAVLSTVGSKAVPFPLPGEPQKGLCKPDKGRICENLSEAHFAADRVFTGYALNQITTSQIEKYNDQLDPLIDKLRIDFCDDSYARETLDRLSKDLKRLRVPQSADELLTFTKLLHDIQDRLHLLEHDINCRELPPWFNTCVPSPKTAPRSGVVTLTNLCIGIGLYSSGGPMKDLTDKKHVTCHMKINICGVWLEKPKIINSGENEQCPEAASYFGVSRDMTVDCSVFDRARKTHQPCDPTDDFDCDGIPNEQDDYPLDPNRSVDPSKRPL